MGVCEDNYWQQVCSTQTQLCLKLQLPTDNEKEPAPPWVNLTCFLQPAETSTQIKPLKLHRNNDGGRFSHL